MINRWLTINKNVVLTAFLFIFMFIIVSPPFTSAQDLNEEQKRNICGGANLSLSKGGSDVSGYNRGCENPSDASGDAEKKLNGTIEMIINIFSVVVGLIAVIIIIVSGLRFITSGGDASKVSSAKNGIIYAAVGLVIVALAQSLVKYVILQVK